ncbi:M13 family metallopeptidase [Dinghuibacter silviterrae]|uniref:Putative endopeptidase n=1 Tax=Dinghuibacter silviterrae TaxID=1539049 RepID=A0A4R8DUX0_9BACT|nr:M13 family metallopeptidase [Dinghuibacter silviterrae]TDX02200.1 putative endopeptidase [Dinghuibacter silviterrae]
MYKYAIILGLCAAAACKEQGKPDILAVNMDTTVRPGDDFFHYANGGWIKGNPIPGDQSAWGIGNLVDEELYIRKRTINEQAVKDRANGGITAKIADFWESGMDSAKADQEGINPIKPELDEIDGIKTTKDLVKVMADLHCKGVNVGFDEGVSQDSKNSDVEAYNLNQGGLGLPDRDYYFNTDKRTTTIREAYTPHIQKMLQLAGYDSVRAEKSSRAIMTLEMTLARNSRKLEDLRDPYRNYNKYSVEALGTLTPSIDWRGWLKAIGINHLDSAIVGQPEFYRTLENELTKESLDTWKDYLRWSLINGYASLLSAPFAEANFDFYGKLMYGLERMKPRWKRVLDVEEGAMGEALGQLFAKEYFNDKAKQRYSDLVEAIRTAYKHRIEKLTWMSDSTKQKALDKLSKIKKKVGYPDKWKDFSAMDIKAQPFARNVMASRQWWNQYEINKLGKPVDRDEWGMTPQTYNAYYNPSNNEIVLPAGIFTVPGMRDEELDDALVYGYAGASTIGHEITHGFDDEGRQFDAQGNLKSWWSPEDSIQFTKRADVMVRQFNGYVPVDTMHINGKATLGENIADLGGVLLGWDAFQQTEQYKKGEKIGGLTPQQRYFLGYALGWLEHEKKELLARQLLTDVHSPAQFRVNGPFADVDAFYEVFGVKPGDKMYLPDTARVKIW